MFDACVCTYIKLWKYNVIHCILVCTKETQYKKLNTGSHSLISINKLKIILAAVYEYCYYYSFSRLPTIFFNNTILI